MYVYFLSYSQTKFLSLLIFFTFTYYNYILRETIVIIKILGLGFSTEVHVLRYPDLNNQVPQNGRKKDT